MLQQLITRMLQSDIVPGRVKAQKVLEEELHRKLELPEGTMEVELPDLIQYGRVTDYYATFKWSEWRNSFHNKNDQF